jgi:diguanylate cyclase
MSEEAQRWKNKYLNKLDEVDSLSKSFGEHVNVLERLLVRVSLAAEGLDKKLDGELANLRNIIRQQGTGSGELNAQLDTIEKHVLAMDRDREGSTDSVLKSISKLVEQLLACDISRDSKKLLKTFHKQLASQVVDLRQYPVLLREFSELQGNALTELYQKTDQQKHGGLIGRFFRSRNDASAAEQTTDAGHSAAKTHEKETTESTLQPQSTNLGDSDRTLDPAPVRLQNTSLTGESNGSSGESFEPGFSAVADHVCSTLDGLVEQLQFPESMEKDVSKVRDKVATGLNWYELVPTLDDIANLVIAAYGKGQKDFETFLKSLDARLISIQSFLEMNRNSYAVSTENKAELKKAMQDHVSAIQQEVCETSDYGALKSTVQADLDAIFISLERYIRKENSREHELLAEMAELQTRLQTMETDSMEMQRQLVIQQQKAMTDGLTGLPNRVAWEHRVQLEFERWKRYGNALTLVVADIDRFKSVNDRYGHLSGDKVIQLIGKEVSHRIRKTDFLARYGGEEFVILLPETTAEVAYGVMDKTRELISRMPFHFQNQKVQVTISVGICEFTEGMSIPDTFERADQALYKAKSAGRNQLQLAEIGSLPKLNSTCLNTPQAGSDSF